MPQDDDRRIPRDDDHDVPGRRLPGDDIDRPPPKKSNSGLVLGIVAGVFLLCCGGAIGVGIWAFDRGKEVVDKAVVGARDTAESEHSRGNLVQIGQGLHAHREAFGMLPTNSRDSQSKPGVKPTSKPLLSWRVHLLPYIGHEALFREFKLDESWDSPHNRALLSRMPDVYITPEARKLAGEGRTFYRGFNHRGAAFESAPFPGPELKLRVPASFPDGLQNTLVVIEAGEPIEWTRPDDINWQPGQPRPPLGGIGTSLPYCQILMMDGTVHKLRKDVPDQTLRWLIDRQDGNVIPQNWEHP